MDANDATTWPANRARINGLWPRYEPTDAERELTVSRLSGLNQRWLAAAIDAYRCDSSSTVFRLADLLTHYRRIADTGTTVAARAPAESPESRRAAEAAALERERVRCVARLRTVARDQIAGVVGELRTAGWLGSKPLPSDFEQWTRHSVFVVCARLDIGYTVHAP